MRRRFFLTNFILIFTPVIVAILLIGVAMLHLTISETQENIELINRQTVERIKENTELIFAEADVQSLNYSVSPNVVLSLEELLVKGNHSDYVRQTTTILKTFLDSSVNSKEFLHSIYIYIQNEDQNFFASMKGLANASNVGDVAWMDEINGMGQQDQRLEFRTINRYLGLTSYTTDVLTLFKPMYTSGRIGQVGTLVMNIDFRYIEQMYEKHMDYPGQIISMVDMEGRVLASTDHSFTNSDFSDDVYYKYVQTNDAYNLAYISMIPRDVLRMQSADMTRLILIVLLLALFLCTILALFITRKNTKNVDQIIDLLAAAEQRVALPEIARQNDVYGYITQNIIKTYLAHNQMNRELLEKKLNLEAMHFSFLQSQLNPHFLFNTLKNIYWKTVRLSGAQNDASQMIEQLSSLLHYTLVEREREVTLEEEINMTHKYIHIQQMRFQDAFIASFDVDAELLSNYCIKFLLQPLIENSISHGLAGRKDGRISIVVREDNGRMLFLVKDNGKGILPERLAEIHESMKQETAMTENIGLYNVNKRLLLAYDPQAALQIQSDGIHCTEISFSIPIHKNINKDHKSYQ